MSSSEGGASKPTGQLTINKAFVQRKQTLAKTSAKAQRPPTAVVAGPATTAPAQHKRKASSDLGRNATSKAESASSAKSEQNEIDPDEVVLRLFDMNMKYGPCLGITRLKRWERAQRNNLNPPENVREILLAALAAGTHPERQFNLWNSFTTL